MTRRLRSRPTRSEEHTSELQSPCNLVCRLLLEKKNAHDYQERAKPRAALPSFEGRDRERRATRVGLRCQRRIAVAHLQLPQLLFFFFNDTATTEIYTLSLHALFRS